MTLREGLERGEIHWANLSAAASIKKKRPVLVIQNNIGNRYSGETIVAAIRHDSQKSLPIHVAVGKGIAGLSKDSLIDCGQIATIPKSMLGEPIGVLPPAAMAAVDRALMVSLGLL